MSKNDFLIDEDIELTLQWLRPLNFIDQETGEPFFDYTDASIPAGSWVYMDQGAQRLRVKAPSGDITAWDGYKLIHISPDACWDVAWREPGLVDTPSFGFCVEEGQLRISLEHMEGKEHLFADFVATMPGKRSIVIYRSDILRHPVLASKVNYRSWRNWRWRGTYDRWPNPASTPAPL